LLIFQIVSTAHRRHSCLFIGLGDRLDSTVHFPSHGMHPGAFFRLFPVVLYSRREIYRLIQFVGWLVCQSSSSSCSGLVASVVTQQPNSIRIKKSIRHSFVRSSVEPFTHGRFRFQTPTPPNPRRRLLLLMPSLAVEWDGCATEIHRHRRRRRHRLRRHDNGQSQ
jgi:hypothetical protein